MPKNGIKTNMIFLYNILFFTVIILCFPLIIPIVLLSDKRRKTVLQRLGFVCSKTDTLQNKFHHFGKKPIWVHALSVGEVLSAEPLVRELKQRFKFRDIVLSVSTKTGFEIANKRLKETVDSIFFYPYDLAFSVKRIAARIDPELVVIVESDIWPNFLFEMKRRHIPVILANARLSKRSFSGYRKVLFFTGPLFLSFANICTQSVEDARRFRCLGVPSDRIRITGNVKFDQENRLLSTAEIEDLRMSMNIKPQQKVLLAGSTHKGEESILLDAFLRLKREFGSLLLIIVPRDPTRARSVCRIFKTKGFSAFLMRELDRAGANKRSDKISDVIIVDAIGVLKKLYALADVAFVGGSLVKHGGHNPLEPAAFSRPIIFGDDMSDFVEISNMLVESGGAVRVQDAESIYNIVSNLLTDDRKAEKMGSMAMKVFNANKGAVEKTLNVIEDLRMETGEWRLKNGD